MGEPAKAAADFIEQINFALGNERTLDWHLLQLHRTNSGLWFRIFGYGLNFINLAIWPFKPSRRYHSPVILGKWWIQTLTPVPTIKTRRK